MASLCLVTTPLLSDLKVTVKCYSMICPAEGTERRNMFLSNIDQPLNFDVRCIYFFDANPDYSLEKIVEMTEAALRILLVPYDFLAGRLKSNPVTGRLEIDCNAAGVGFSVASSELALAELEPLSFPNSAFEQLLHHHHFHMPYSCDRPLFLFQLTSFKCGGFAMSISRNHILMDGVSLKIFLENLASLAAGQPLPNIPYCDRTLLAARSPPQVPFTHPELLEISELNGLNQHDNIFQDTPENLDVRVYRLSGSDIMKLKNRVQRDIYRDEASGFKITSFSVVLAHIWRCKALLGSVEEYDPEKISTVLYAVDIRSRLGSPAFPSSYTGNAVITAYGMVKMQEMEKKLFSDLVRVINEGTNRVTDEYIRSVIDWGEVHKGFPHGDVLVSSWWKLGFEKVVFPWGRPKYFCPLVHYRKDIILLFPEVDGVINDGVNILVALPSADMEKFEKHFTEYLI